MMGLGVLLAASAQNVATAGLHEPVNADDAVVTGGVLRTQLLRDSLMLNPETGQMEKVPVVVKNIDVPVDQLGNDPEAALKARTLSRANGSDHLEYLDYYSGTAFYLFFFNYPSIDKHGNKIILSSLIAFPYFSKSDWNNGYRFNNVVIACHCTITSNKECPSYYTFKGEFESDVNMMQYYASWGKFWPKKDKQNPAYYNVVIMPDYEGYGVTRTRPHPYLYQELTARQVIDGVRYGLALFRASKFQGKDEDVSIQWAQREDAFRWGRYYSIGASQGGSVAMAVHRFIEQNNLTDLMPFAGSICCDGPYDPVATLKYYMTADEGANHKAGELTMPVAIALIVKGMLDTNPLMMKYKATDFFTQDFLDTGILDMIANKQYDSLEKTTEDVEKHLKALSKQAKFKNMLNSEGRANMQYVLTPRAWEYMTALTKGTKLPDYEEMHDLISALESNNLTRGWTPRNPICLYHSQKDTVVPFANCQSALDAFKGKTTIYLDMSDTDDHKAACKHFMFTSLGKSPDIKFVWSLFMWGGDYYPAIFP